jgi:ribonuclease BN (tRNA processing enzyme)
MHPTTGGLVIKRACTQAGLHSSILVESKRNRDKFLLDCGTIIGAEVLGSKYVFITHGHTDHIGAVVAFARARNNIYKSVCIFYVPSSSLDPLLKIKALHEEMDEREIPMDIRVINVGDDVMIGSANNNTQFRVHVFGTFHRVQSQGYAFYSRNVTRGHLFGKFQELEGKELGALRKQGVAITSPDIVEENLDLVYTGDTTFPSLVTERPFIFQAETLIMECTYLEIDPDAAAKWEHVHMGDIIDHKEVFENVKRLVLCHLSGRYNPYAKALDVLRKNMPSELISKTHVTLKTMGSRHEVTGLSRAFADFEKTKRTMPGAGFVPSYTRNNKKKTRETNDDNSNNIDNNEKNSVSNASGGADNAKISVDEAIS